MVGWPIESLTKGHIGPWGCAVARIVAILNSVAVVFIPIWANNRVFATGICLTGSEFFSRPILHVSTNLGDRRLARLIFIRSMEGFHNTRLRQAGELAILR